ncbi:MAG: Sir2 family NAD-dependent protein deacetylase [Dehalococcoidia bacterium]|nr:Sir2 family NAD-dependent protein deacetylase [Dehalococcoidia bacterium]MDW8120587.1 Sir2 family NAD-dependent protein deacetylase [Chloroflexota bacterium]
MHEWEKAVLEAVQCLRASRYVVALVGAGLSRESGIPTFRGPDGLWTRYGEPPMDGYQRFLRDPRAYWEEQMRPDTEGPRAELARAIAQAKPNPGHFALVALERMGILRCTITQNVDNLHREAGSQRLIEIHGNRTFLRCIGCGLRVPRKEFVIKEIPPPCPECGGLIKGDGVMFGEPIPRAWLEACYEETAQCDCMLLVGTSGTVYPAAGFPQMVKMQGGRLIEINPLQTHLTPLCDVVVRASAAVALPRLVEMLSASPEGPSTGMRG